MSIQLKANSKRAATTHAAYLDNGAIARLTFDQLRHARLPLLRRADSVARLLSPA